MTYLTPTVTGNDAWTDIWEEQKMQGHAQVERTVNTPTITRCGIEGPSQMVKDQLNELWDAIADCTDALNGNLRNGDDDPHVQIVEHQDRVTVTVSTVLYDTGEAP